MGEEDPTWLEWYVNKFVLADDIPALCKYNNCTKEQADKILDIIRKQGFLENIDKDINLWFHNNSFRGLFKEKVILVELTDRIINAKPTLLTEIQAKLRDEAGNEDVCLKIDTKKMQLKSFRKKIITDNTVISSSTPCAQHIIIWDLIIRYVCIYLIV